MYFFLFMLIVIITIGFGRIDSVWMKWIGGRRRRRTANFFDRDSTFVTCTHCGHETLRTSGEYICPKCYKVF